MINAGMHDSGWHASVCTAWPDIMNLMSTATTQPMIEGEGAIGQGAATATVYLCLTYMVKDAATATM